MKVRRIGRVHVYLRSGYTIYGCQARVSMVVMADFLRRTGYSVYKVRAGCVFMKVRVGLWGS